MDSQTNIRCTYIHVYSLLLLPCYLFLLCMCNNELLFTVKHAQITTSKILVATFYYDTTMIMQINDFMLQQQHYMYICTCNILLLLPLLSLLLSLLILVTLKHANIKRDIPSMLSMRVEESFPKLLTALQV